jgi:hypothetical protein
VDLRKPCQVVVGAVHALWPLAYQCRKQMNKPA